MMLVHDILEHSALQVPDKIALVCKKQRLTYRHINELSDKVAAHLVKIGVQRHDRVAILLNNSVISVVSLFGILKAGATFIMLNASMKSTKLNYVLKDSGSTVLITHQNKHKTVKQAVPDCKDLRYVIWCHGPRAFDDKLEMSASIINLDWDSILADPPSLKKLSFPRSIDLDLSNIIYTSGSTGDPKGVMSAHYNVIAATRSISSYLRMNADDIVMNVLPLSFDYGLYQIFMTFLVQGTLVLEESFSYPYKILEQLENEKATGFPIVPTMAALILQMKNLSKFDFSRLRFISNTAAALPVTFIDALQKIFKKTDIFSMYGLTECKRVSYLPPEDIERKPGSVGIAMPNEEVFIVDQEGNELEAGNVGELVVRGSNVMQGYWNDPETTAKVFRPGKYHGETLLYSGDLFKKDEDGYLYFVSRKDDMIKTKGERVSPKEIEAVLHNMDGIADVAVFGVPDHVFGQAIVACIRLNNGTAISERELKKYCTDNLEPFMVPKYFKFMDDFPLSASRKIDKKLMAEDYINKINE